EAVVARYLVRERYELRVRMDDLRRELMNVIDVREMIRRILASLEESRRVTHASIYLLDPDGAGYDLAGHIGPRPVDRMDVATRRPFCDRLRSSPVLIEQLERELREIEAATAESAPNKEVETLDAIARTLDELKASAAVPILGGGGDDIVLGVLGLRDERMRDAFGLDDLDLFRALAAQAAITIENSRVYERMKERDRLAALGEMAAGLAHETRNPRGAIRGAARLLAGGAGEPVKADDVGEFISIIVEEVNRLNKVVSQFLDYARPYKGEPAEVDVNEVVRKTMQILEAHEHPQKVKLDVRLSAE